MKDALDDFGCGEDLAPALLPSSDLHEFFRLTTRNQARVRKLMEIFAAIDSAASKKAGLAMAVAIGEGERGYSVQRIEAMYYDWKKSGDWRVGINWAYEGTSTKSVPDAFVVFLQAQVDKRTRKMQQGLKLVRDMWRKGADIPGYGTWRQWWARENPGLTPPAYCPGFPDGWTLRNLRRYLDASKFRRIAQTIGRTAAKSHRSRQISTRKGLWRMSHVMWDDMEHNFFVNSLAEKQAGRPLELFSHDLYTARKVRYGFRIKTAKEDGSLNKLTEKMMRMIVAATFYLDGYSPRGTVCCAEHGTAAIRDWMEKLLWEISGGLITTARSGFNGDPAHLGQYPGIRRGNPNFKASLESSNNLFQNVLDHLPGQTGKDLAHRPEGLHGLLDYNAELIAASQVMPPEIAANLQYPILTDRQLHDVLQHYYAYIENDTDHELEGWEDCGHVVQELELAGRWITQQDLLALPPAQHDMAMLLLSQGHIRTRPRQMSRREAWDRDTTGLIRIPGYGVCAILGDDLSEERKVRESVFEFEDSEVGPGVHTYHCVVETLDGHRLELKEGETYQTFVNPFAIGQLFVRDARGRYIGVADRVQASCRADRKSIERGMAAAAKREGELLKPLRDRQVAAVKERAERSRHNADLIEQAEGLPQLRAQDKQTKKAAAFGRIAASHEPEAMPERTPAIVEEFTDSRATAPTPTIIEEL